jgi:hypothetical protein
MNVAESIATVSQMTDGRTCDELLQNKLALRGHLANVDEKSFQFHHFLSKRQVGSIQVLVLSAVEPVGKYYNYNH